MAFIFGTASNPAEFYRVWRNFVTGCGTPGKVEFTGTGNGGINNLQFPRDSEGMYQTFTLTCVTVAERGGTFSVVGSQAGVMPNAVVAQTYKHPLVEFWIDFGDVDYQLGDQFIISAVAMPSGAPRFLDLQGRQEIKTETVTLTCTSPTIAVDPIHPATFEVVGSVSGPLPNLTQGVVYSNNYLHMHLPLEDGFELDDTIVVEFMQNPLRAINQHWEILRKTPNPADTFWGFPVPDVDRELIIRGPGFSGNDNIFYGVQFFHNDGTGDAWFRHYGLTGYLPNMDMDSQPNAKANNSASQASHQPIHPFWSQQIPYTVIASGRCFKILSRSNIYYSQSYQGLFLPSSLPKYHGYPYYNGGTGDSRSTQWSNVADARSSFWDWRGATISNSGGGSGLYLNRNLTWTVTYGNQSETSSSLTMRSPGTTAIYPYAQNMLYNLRDNFDGTIPMFQAEINNNHGFLDGVFAVPARDGRQPEDILVNQDGSRAIVVQNHHRSGFGDFCAFMLN